MIAQLFYVSDVTSAMDEAEWRRIEETSSIHNAFNGITGLCCYDGRGFMQLIEGPPDKAEALLDRIKSDHCHTNLVVQHRGVAAHASYGEWAMRFCRLDDAHGDRRREIETLLAPSLLPELRELMLAWSDAVSDQLR